MKVQEFLEELMAENPQFSDKLHFKCYTLEENSLIKVIIFSYGGWENCYIGFLINENFHVLGLGSFSFINEDARAPVSYKQMTQPTKRII